MTTTRFGFEVAPTIYNGITFRSRLEARWAIVLDELGFGFEYEPEAIRIQGWYIKQMGGPDQFWYLPDFYVPQMDCFFEVKGALKEFEYLRLLDIARTITTPRGGHPGREKEFGARPFLILGNFGPGFHSPMPISLFNDCGEIFAKHDFSASSSCFEHQKFLANDGSGNALSNYEHDSHFLCNNKSTWSVSGNWGIAINKAKKVRFEGGRHV